MSSLALTMRRCVVGSESVSRYALRGKTSAKGSKKKGKSAEQSLSDYEKRREMMGQLMGSVEPRPRDMPKLSEEEKDAQIAMKKMYSRYMQHEDNMWRQGLMNRYKIRQHALTRLRRIDEKLWEAACVPDMTPFPLAREIPVDTPPIPDFEPIANN
eukprot:CFRG3325T1